MTDENKTLPKADFNELTEKLERIEIELAKQHSFKRQMRRAIINGVFGSFGATIVFGTILIIAAYLIKGAEQIPLLNDIIERTKLEQIVDNYNDIPVGGELETE